MLHYLITSQPKFGHGKHQLREENIVLDVLSLKNKLLLQRRKSQKMGCLRKLESQLVFIFCSNGGVEAVF